MKIVLDTNVLVSGLLNPYGAPGQIVRMVAAGELALCFDARLLAEYRDVLLRPAFDFPAEQVAAIMEQIRFGGVLTAGRPLRQPLPDREDEPFLEVALAGGAQWLVTGNVRHYPAALREGIRVISPAEFIERLRGGAGSR